MGFDIAAYIIFFILVMFGAYYATRWISMKSASLFRGKNISIIERVPVDKDKSFVLLKKGEKVYLIGVTNQNMTVIDNFSSSECVDKASETVVPQTAPIQNITKRIGEGIAIFIKKSAEVFKKAKIKLSENHKTKKYEPDVALELGDDHEIEDVMKNINSRKQHLKAQGELLKRGGVNEAH